MNKKTYLTIGSVIVIAGMLVWWALNTETPDRTAFAQCLAAKNITMYGAEWCPHCQNEKRAFGPAFEFVPYVECPDESQVCLDKGIRGYPTWILPDGRKLEGEQGLDKLSAESGCPLSPSLQL